MSAPLTFWAVALVVGASAWPICAVVFRRFPDAGAGLAFALGVTLVGWTYFILRVGGILPAGTGGALAAIGLLALAGAVVAVTDRRFRATFKRSRPGLLITAGVFTMLFFGFVAFRSYTPEIVGTEQPMDLMFLNSAMSSPDYPPDDLWLAGERASYYYFGYVQIGVLSLAADQPASTGYNLGLAFVFAASGTAMASVAFAVARWLLRPGDRRWAVWAASASVVILLGAGTLWGIFALAAAHENYNAGLFEAFGVEALLPCEPGQAGECYAGPSPRTDRWYPTEYFWWFQGTRVIPGTITEFPIFSFILGDLHPHLMSMPLVLLTIAFSAVIWRGRGRLSIISMRKGWPQAALIALVVGALAFQNAWDLVTFSALVVLAIVARNWRAGRRGASAALDTAGYFGPIAITAVVAYLPWLLDFSSQAEGIYPYVGEGTRPVHLLLQFGPVVIPALLAAVLAWMMAKPTRTELVDTAWWTSLVWMVPVVAWLALATYHEELNSALDARTAGGWLSLLFLGATAWLLATLGVVTAGRKPAVGWLVGAATVGVLLLYGLELFLVKDVFFGGDLSRMNTVFKLSYQAWILLALAGGIGFVLAFRASRIQPVVYVGALPVAAIVVGSLVYGLAAVPARTDGFAGVSEIDGLAFVAASDPDEYALTNWLRGNVRRGEVVVEASGRTWAAGPGGELTLVNSGVDYSDASRLSARAGRPTYVGWTGHEIQWRGDSPERGTSLTMRQDLVDGIYLAADADAALGLLEQIDAQYVALGRVELDRYPAAEIVEFDLFMDVVFSSGDMRVYRVPGRQEIEN